MLIIYFVELYESNGKKYLFHFAEMKSVLVVCPELHEAHIARLWELRYAFYARKEPAIQKMLHDSMAERL